MVLDLHKHSAFWSNDFSTWKPKNGAFGGEKRLQKWCCLLGGEKLDEACQEFGWHCGVMAGTISRCRRRWKDADFRFFFWRCINLYILIHTYTDTYQIPVPTNTWACPLILQELQENKWRNLLPGAWAGSDCLQWILLKVTFAGRGNTPHAAKILPD